MKTLSTLALLITLIVIGTRTMQAQQAGTMPTSTVSEALSTDTLQSAMASSPTGPRIWANGGLGFGSNILAITGSINVLHDSRIYSAFVMGTAYDTKSHTDIGVLYGFAGGDQWMYSIAAGVAYVYDSQITFTSETPGYKNNITRTIGFPIQIHGSFNYYAVGLDLGLHLCVSSRSSAAVILGINIGKLWR